MQTKRTALLILTLLLTPASTRAQVFDLGPSSPNLFDTVINIPPDVAMTSAGNSTQINLAPGGKLLNDFDANAGSEINISGGIVGPHPTRLYANSGSEVNISGGTITNLVADSGSIVNFLGGGRSNSIFRANSGSVLRPFRRFQFSSPLHRNRCTAEHLWPRLFTERCSLKWTRGRRTFRDNRPGQSHA